MSYTEFKAPGPGSWELEQTHFAKPATRYMSAISPEPTARGFGEGTKRYGLLLDTLRMAFVNDFAYAKFVPVGAPDNAVGPPPRLLFMLLTRLHPEIRRRVASAPGAFAAKLWREDMRRWDEEVKPDSIARNNKLQKTDIAALDEAAFLAYLKDIRANVAEMIYRHHIFTIPCCFPVGHFLAQVQQWTSLPSGEVLGLLKGAAPVSRGVWAGSLGRLRTALAAGGVTADTYRGRPAIQVLDDLRSRSGVAGPLQEFLDEVAYRLVSGYDVSEKFGLEMPEMLVGAIFGATDTADRQGDFTKRRDVLRAKVPEAHRAEFDELLEEARFIHRLRDERGIFNDAWGSGLARRAILEAGRRLKDGGVLPDAALAINASHDEILGLLTGDKSPTVDELRRRQTWRDTKTVSDAPPFLGPEPKGPPPIEWLPKKARANARAVDTVIREIFQVPEQKAPPRSVAGLPVHPGVYEGPARIISGPQDFNRLQQGDVLVTRNTGPSFNVVLPLLGAIVTDRGGQLSHAAIVAREYGIPAVVGTREATTMFADGARVRVDGDKGVVTLVEAGEVRPTALVDAIEEAHYGGKAASLARSLRAGLPVPPGFALSTTVVEAVCGGNAEALNHLRVQFAGLAGPCAVRSSAIGEDSEAASFAGQHITILNVRHLDHVSDAVAKVRESAHTESARAYRRTLGMDETPLVGVVVQRMIEPDCAGVMFTRNPLNGSDERVIEAAWGLGEAVVAGLVVPDNYAIDGDGAVLRRTPGEKDLALRGDPEGGTFEEAVAEDLVNALCLNDKMLAGLHELAVRCETCFGRGLDIEWAFAGDTLYLLQCRAMTRNR